MRKLFYTALAAMALALPMLTACSDDDPTPIVKPVPTDSTQTDTTHDDHDHEEEAPARVVLTLASGHFHGVKFHGDGINATIYPENAPSETVEPKFHKSVQSITLERVDKRWRVAEGSDSVFRVLAAGNYATPYGLWITYYNDEGEVLNQEFGGAEGVNAHQHFFTAHNVRPTADGDATAKYDANSLFTYTYMDTNPWDRTLAQQGTELIGSEFISEGNFKAKNPVGLKGFFSFNEPRTRFDIRVRLKHFEGNSKFVNGVPYAFNKPAAVGHDEVSFSFPVIVFASRQETELFETTVKIDWATRTVANYADFTTEEQRYVESLRAAYGCTLEEILWDFYLHYDGGLNAESSTWWF